MTTKELVAQYLSDEDIWEEFLDNWIGAHPDKVKEIVGKELEDSEDYYAFLEQRAEAEISDAIDRAYEEQREVEYMQHLEKGE